MVHSEGVFHDQWDVQIRPLIDAIDSLRFMGIDEDLALPAIAVIGDQSSGKSSVLEALSGVGLPRGSGIVTRCPLELKLRKLKPGMKWKATISYKDTRIDFDDPSLVEGSVIAAQDDLAGKGVGICSTLIRLEIMSPDVCDLTLIDLPGITRVPVSGQPEDISVQIKNLILHFIEKSETINLVVVPCNVDIATTEALRMAQEVDPEGKRTLAILTKPDLVDRGTEGGILAIALNQVIPLKKGYIMVKCRGQQQIDEKTSLAEATRMEKDFFKQHQCFSSLLDEGKATTVFLAAELTRELVTHIKDSLPRLSDQVNMKLAEVKTLLSQHKSGPPEDPQLKKEFFIDIITQFSDKIKSLVSGEVINDENLYILLRGQFNKFKDGLEESKGLFTKAVEEVVAEYDEKSRGRELLAFNDWRVFDKTVQTLVKGQQHPALATLYIIKDTIQVQFTEISRACFSNYPFLRRFSVKKIEEIQAKQEAIVKERINEQFKMEQLVYTQDSILKERVGDADSSRGNYPMILKEYYEVVVKRLADQIPMLIQHFLLHESAHVLCLNVLGLMDHANLDECLDEDTECSHRRKELQNRMERLIFAHEKLSYFL
ncbi:interferon-induced GTP-binding protein Mx2-like [Clupea harengus]|uniref:Interferon-induced GTP-binding protein Mx2-like n=1 Tax=Clupea harengus TaxID=7950 RepID=A0A6P3W6E5_CLUHA|nr:interferon-induced GTP-binding protein Mx2-like [Clupea harengus]